MSDQSQGPGWWQASDGRWYPPEQHPDAAQTSPSDDAGTSGQAEGPPPAPGAAGAEPSVGTDTTAETPMPTPPAAPVGPPPTPGLQNPPPETPPKKKGVAGKVMAAVVITALIVAPLAGWAALALWGESDDDAEVATVSTTTTSTTEADDDEDETTTTTEDDEEETTTTTADVPGATGDFTSFEDVGGDPIPVLEVPIVDAETAADLMSDVLFDGLDEEAELWGLEDVWSELLPGIGFNDGSEPADPETISGLSIVPDADGNDAMFVVVEDVDGNCSGLAITVEGTGWSSSQLFSIDGECSGQAVAEDQLEG